MYSLFKHPFKPMKLFGLNVVDTILVTGGGDPNTIANNKDLFLKAYEAGKAI